MRNAGPEGHAPDRPIAASFPERNELRLREIRELVVRWMTEPDEPLLSRYMHTIPASPDDVLYLLDLIEGHRKLMVEADSFISHMLYRGSWPGERWDVERLIGRLRKESDPVA